MFRFTSILLTFTSFLFCLSCAKEHAQEELHIIEMGEDALMISEAPQEGETLNGFVIKVLDGDTYDVRTAAGDTLRIRMEGIDAPEGGMHYYRVSKNYLRDLIGNKQVRIRINGKDGKRFIADTYLVDGTDISLEMLDSGLAWHYKHFNSYPAFAAAEENARNDGEGLWEEPDPVPPWIFRRVQRKGFPYKDFDRFRIREYSLNSQGNSITHGKVKVEMRADNVGGSSVLRIVKNGRNAGEFPIKGQSIRLSFADYTMNGNEDIKITSEKEKFYLFFNPVNQHYETKEGWDIDVWKLNKPEKLVLAYPDGTPYKGKVKLYGLDENLNLKELESFSYN